MSYILGSGVGSTSRFARSALIKRAVICKCSNNNNNNNNNNINENLIISEDGTPNAQTTFFEIWYDGSDISKFQPSSILSNPTEVESITQWNDKSTQAHNANNYIGTTAARPVYIGTLSDDIQNNNTNVSFEQAQNQGFEIDLTGSGNWYFGLQSITIFLVFKYKELSTTDNLTVWSSSQNDLNLAISGSSQNIILSSPKTNPTGSYNVDTSYNLVNNTWFQTTTVFNGIGITDSDKLKFRVNGVEKSLNFASSVGTTIGPNGGNGSIGIGMNVWNNNNTEFFNGNIGEILVYSKALSQPEILNIENYLINKWIT